MERWKTAHRIEPHSFPASSKDRISAKGAEGEAEDWEKVYQPWVRVRQSMVLGERKNSETMEANKRHVNQNGNKSIFKCGMSAASTLPGFGSKVRWKSHTHTQINLHILEGYRGDRKFAPRNV